DGPVRDRPGRCRGARRCRGRRLRRPGRGRTHGSRVGRLDRTHPARRDRRTRPSHPEGGAMSELRVHLPAFRHNVATLAAIAAPARTMLAVKAEAYGHEMLPVARAALEAGADSLAALEVPAALALRDAGIDVPIFAWLHGADTDFRAEIGSASCREWGRD